MKKLVMTALVVLCLCLPVQADIYSWIWGDDDAIGARIGTDISESIEIGASALWFPDQESPRIWGMYGIYHLPEIVQFPNPIILDFLPDTIGGRPYFGGKLDIDFDIDKARVSLIAGIVFEDILFIEYNFESIDSNAYNDSKILFGLRIRF